MKIGIDIGGSHIGIGIVENGRITKKLETEIFNSINIEKYIANSLEKMIDTLNIQNENIELIGIAIPGSVKNGVAYHLVNFDLEKLDITSIVKKLFTKKDVKIICKNDGKCSGLAEKTYGSLTKYKDAVFLCIGTGIGGAVFMENKLLMPSRFSGFELGHMVIDKKGKPCHCGNNGCFEKYASIKSFKETACKRLKIPSNIIGEELLQLIKENEHNLKDIIDEYIQNLTIGISNIINIFEPEAICLGGGFVYYKDILYHHLVNSLKEKKYLFNKKDDIQLVLAELGNDAGMIGATI